MMMMIYNNHCVLLCYVSVPEAGRGTHLSLLLGSHHMSNVKSSNTVTTSSHKHHQGEVNGVER